MLTEETVDSTVVDCQLGHQAVRIPSNLFHRPLSRDPAVRLLSDEPRGLDGSPPTDPGVLGIALAEGGFGIELVASSPPARVPRENVLITRRVTRNKIRVAAFEEGSDRVHKNGCLPRLIEGLLGHLPWELHVEDTVTSREDTHCKG